MAEAVIFDCGDVLVTGLKASYNAIGALLNVHRDDVRAQLLLSKVMTRLFNGEITEAEYWDTVIAQAGWTCDAELLRGAVRKHFREVPGTRAIVTEVRRAGLRTGLLSTHVREWADDCEQRFQIHQLFHAVHYSYQTRIPKPDLRAYRDIARDLEVAPQECIFVDDREDNCLAAAEVGMRSIQFQDAAQLSAELAHMLGLID